MAYTDPLERDHERYLIEQVRLRHGRIRKVRWIGRRGAPDRMIWIPGWKFPRMIELKAPGKKPSPQQEREIERVRRMRIIVYVCDSFEQIDQVLNSR